ncbi:hypothetical protein HMPREF9711_00912 [Myroides odoratimimus CCUG 3837]|uniref:EpsG family protein n=1 Tax=Myroides odoratimimus TaxID=76832 RepID=UPI000280AC9C|nr:EpsG family protein [Myroides odoratimimus]EKB05943.1 hypothetical protein HMPREF9711_00912 [Myroides odoratimimus CCUG 3837]
MEVFFSNYFLIMFVTFVGGIMYLLNIIRGLDGKVFDKIFYIVSILMLLILFGLRAPNIGTDTINYLNDFKTVSKFDNFNQAIKFSTIARDPFFVGLTFFSSKLWSAKVYLFSLSLLYFFLVHKLITRYCKDGKVVVLLVFLCFGFFYSMGINIIRSGISVLLAILGCVNFIELDSIRNNKKRVLNIIFLFLLSILFHSSAILIVLSSFIVKYLKIKIQWFYLGLGIAIVLSYLNFGVNSLPLVGPIIESNDRLTKFASGEMSQEASGFNLYVVFFQLFVLFYGIYFLKQKDYVYEYLLKIYILTTSFYFLCLNLSFSDRFGLLSWIFIPLLLIYPFIKNKKIILNKNFILFVASVFVYFALMYYRYLDSYN